MIAHNPLHRSGQADFPHPAPTSGNDAHATQRKRMTYASRWQPVVDQASHSRPGNVPLLAATRQHSMPAHADLFSKQDQRGAVHGYPVIADMPTNHRAQPLARLRNGIVHTSSQFGFHLPQLCLQPFANRLPQHREVTVAPLLPADMREAEEVERLRFPSPRPLRCCSANGPNSRRRVFSGCSSRPNFCIRSLSSVLNRSASILL
jgi:hypothetical protein